MSSQAEWTWLIYMAGDNNLEGAGKEDLDEMQIVGSDSKINIVVQFDTEQNKTTRYLVEKNNLKVLQEMPGVNCGDPKVLTDFIKWGTKNYPANYYLVNVWNHGGGWENLPADYNWENVRSSNPLKQSKIKQFRRALFVTTIKKIHRKIRSSPNPERLIAMDVGSQDYLDNQELRKAIFDALPNGRKIDILGCDACLMNMVEICYENKDVADYMVGSEEVEPGSGWPYTMILKKLAVNPEMTPRELSKVVTQEYGKYYDNEGDKIADQFVTQSAIDLAQVNSLADSVNELAEILIKDLNNVLPGVTVAKDKAQRFSTPEYIDLLSFCEQLTKRLPNNNEVKDAVKKISDKINGPTSSLVIANVTWGDTVKDANGVSIYFPTAQNYSADYSDLLFSKDCKWNEFLTKFFSAE
jgi:cysteine peptidase C11 family protein